MYYSVSFLWADVLLSVCLGITGAYSGLECCTIARRAASDQIKKRWLLMAACSFGYSMTFSMHFVAMQAVTLDGGNRIQYSLPLMLSSIPFIIAATYTALMLLRNETKESMMGEHKWKVPLSGLIMAVGIGVMHYSGMLAVCGPFELEYPYGLVVFTVVMAVTLSSVGLFIAYSFKGANQRTLGALLLGGGVTGVHYLGVANFGYLAKDTDSCSPLGEALGGRVSTDVIAAMAATAAFLNFCSQVTMPQQETKFLRKVMMDVAGGINTHTVETPVLAAVRTLKNTKAPLEVKQKAQKHRSKFYSMHNINICQMLEAQLPPGQLFPLSPKKVVCPLPMRVIVDRSSTPPAKPTGMNSSSPREDAVEVEMDDRDLSPRSSQSEQQCDSPQSDQQLESPRSDQQCETPRSDQGLV